MADTDNSSPILRYNLVSNQVEYFQGSDFYPISMVAAGVSSLNTLTGAVVLAAGSNITLTPSGNTITIASTGGSGITTLTGDVTAGPGSGSQAATLATVNSDVGSFTNANITVNAKGLITAASNGSGGGASPNVASFVDTTGLDTTNNTFTVTPTSVALTASSNTASIMISVSGSIQSANPSVNPVYATLFKDGTDVTGGAGLIAFFDNASTAFTGIPCSFVWLDTPGDTSPHTYAVAIKGTDGATTCRWLNDTGSPSGVIIAQEIH